MNEIFKAFDKNNDGILSREELIQGFLPTYHNDMQRTKIEVEFILSKLDLNGSGEVDYSGKDQVNVHFLRIHFGYHKPPRDA